MKQHLFLMLGYPGSGKSHFARQLATKIGAVRLNGDSIRKYMFSTDQAAHDKNNAPLVFGALDYVVSAILAAGHSVIYDASHNRLIDRTKGRELGAPHGIKPILIWIQTETDVAFQRQNQRELTIDQTRVPEKRFQELVRNLTPPTAEEKVIKINGQLPFDEQLASFYDQLEKL